MESIIKALKDTPVPNVLIWAGLLFLLLGFVTKLGGVIEVQPNQKRLTIPIGLLLLTFGLVLNFTPATPTSPPTTPAPAPASPFTTQISTKPLETSGLYLASTTLLYPDGDQLKADFRVYCPASTIRPTNYVLVDGKGTVKKHGAWWEPAFTPKYDSERQLIKEVCDSK